MNYQVGLGTYRMHDKEIIKEALALGYRLIDTATVYGNEHLVGEAIRESGIDRKSLFITSKLSPRDQGRESCKKAVRASLEKTGLDYLDCYLIHWPAKSGLNPQDLRNKQYRRESYMALEEMLKEGLLKNIGVSNYNVKHLRELLEFCDIKPWIVQNEIHPYYVLEENIEFCIKENIQLQAYSSFAEGNLLKQVPNEVSDLAKQGGMTHSQVLLRWALDQNIWVIPKASTKSRLQENLEARILKSKSDLVLALQPLNSKHIKYCWDPSKVE